MLTEAAKAGITSSDGMKPSGAPGAAAPARGRGCSPPPAWCSVCLRYSRSCPEHLRYAGTLAARVREGLLSSHTQTAVWVVTASPSQNQRHPPGGSPSALSAATRLRRGSPPLASRRSALRRLRAPLRGSGRPCLASCCPGSVFAPTAPRAFGTGGRFALRLQSGAAPLSVQFPGSPLSLPG